MRIATDDLGNQTFARYRRAETKTTVAKTAATFINPAPQRPHGVSFYSMAYWIRRMLKSVLPSNKG